MQKGPQIVEVDVNPEFMDVMNLANYQSVNSDYQYASPDYQPTNSLSKYTAIAPKPKPSDFSIPSYTEIAPKPTTSDYLASSYTRIVPKPSPSNCVTQSSPLRESAEVETEKDTPSTPKIYDLPSRPSVITSVINSCLPVLTTPIIVEVKSEADDTDSGSCADATLSTKSNDVERSSTTTDSSGTPKSSTPPSVLSENNQVKQKKFVFKETHRKIKKRYKESGVSTSSVTTITEILNAARKDLHHNSTKIQVVPKINNAAAFSNVEKSQNGIKVKSPRPMSHDFGKNLFNSLSKKLKYKIHRGPNHSKMNDMTTKRAYAKALSSLKPLVHSASTTGITTGVVSTAIASTGSTTTTVTASTSTTISARSDEIVNKQSPAERDDIYTIEDDGNNDLAMINIKTMPITELVDLWNTLAKIPVPECKCTTIKKKSL